MCLYPTLVRNRKYTKTKKNGGVVPIPPDPRVLYFPAGCGKCIECMKQKSRNWMVRLLEDIKTHKNGKFITFTFSNESYKRLYKQCPEQLEGYDRDNWIATKAIRLFLERFRRKYKKSIRHWLVTELGHHGTENIHIHGIIWTNENLDEIDQIWGYGFMWKGIKRFYYQNKYVYVNYVNEHTVKYITKYMHKIDHSHKGYKPKVLTSKGIGNNFTKGIDWKKNLYNGKDTIETYRTTSGHKIAMPIYWRNKIYTETQREELWLHRLDKQERWVCGEKIDIRKGTEEYYGSLKWYRRKNRELGYGDNTKSWEIEEYEKQRREMLQAERIRAA